MMSASLRSKHSWKYASCLLLLAIGIGTGPLNAQGISLLPSIGLSTQPQDADPICYIPIVAGQNRGYKDTGPAIGAVPPDFTLYDLHGGAFVLSEQLAKRKPILLVNGSYTCPIFRERISLINDIVRDRGDVLTVAIIYTIEAHPFTDTSVYYGYVNVTKQNNDEGVLYRQPRTYAERKQVVADMLANLPVNAPVYLDGPCNEWWKSFGPAPNNAFLIDTNGVVFAKHGWFDRYPDNIESDIARLLGENVQHEDSAYGSFELMLQSSPVVTGPVNEALYAYAELRNNSGSKVEIDIVRRSDDVPEGWSTALCTDICFDTSVDSTRVVLEPGETQSFIFYFYTGPSVDTARATLIFRNPRYPQNRYVQVFTGVTESTTSTIADHAGEENGTLSLFPNPATGRASARFTLKHPQQVRLDLFDLLGKHIDSPRSDLSLEAGRHVLPLPLLPAGIYFVRLRTGAEESYGTLRITQ